MVLNSHFVHVISCLAYARAIFYCLLLLLKQQQANPFIIVNIHVYLDIQIDWPYRMVNLGSKIV